MTFNKEASIGLINRTLYSKEFYRKIQKTRMITSSVMIACIFLAIGLLISCFLITHDIVWVVLMSIACGLIAFQVLFSLFMAIINSIRIKKFVFDRYHKWIMKYYVICSENFSNFSMGETEKPNEFLCSFGTNKFALRIEPDCIKIAKENGPAPLKIDNTQLRLFNHDISLSETKLLYVRRDLYFECNRIVSKSVATFIEKDIEYILEKAYGNC